MWPSESSDGCAQRRGCGWIAKAQATARVDVPQPHGNVVVFYFGWSDVGALLIIETQKSSHWNEKRRHCPR